MRMVLDRTSFPLEIEVQDTKTNRQTSFVLNWADKPDRLVVVGVEVEKKSETFNKSKGGEKL